MNSLVSIIIPVYNRENLIKKTIESIIAQSYKNWECIIVDDGSDDNTIEVIEEFVNLDSRIKLFLRPKNVLKGANSCRNIGFSKSKGKFINWFDSDDLMMEDFLKEKIVQFNNFDIVLSKTIRIREEKEEFEYRTRLTNNLVEDYITRTVSWYLPDGMFKRSFLLNSKIEFTEGLKGGQDRDFYIKALVWNPKINVIDFYATKYIIHTHSISEKLYRNKDVKDRYSYDFSLFESLINQVKLLKKSGLLSKKLERHYFIDIKKKLPCVFYFKNKRNVFFSTLIDISNYNFFYLKQWFKILLTSLIFLIFGKGEKFLK